METELQTAPVAEPEKSEGVLDLRQTIDDSKKILKAESAAIESAPRAGGRPPGSKDKRPRARWGSKKGKLKLAPEPAASVPTEGLEDPQVSMLPAIAAVVKVPFDIAANKTGCEALRVNEDEAAPSAAAIDQCLRIYFPDLMDKNPKEMALISLAIALGTLGMHKINAFSEYKKSLAQNPPSANANVDPAATPEVPAGGGRPAQDYFAPRAFSS